MELARLDGPPGPCSYLPDQTATLQYRYIIGIAPADYQTLLCRGWRRFGYTFFRPICQSCQRCRSLRVKVDDFRETRSQRRVLKKNRHIRVLVRKPSVSQDHLKLYELYHADMHERRGWPHTPIDRDEYYESFVAGAGRFGREFLYMDGNTLVGVGYVDILPRGLSSVYFFHHPDWRKLSPGTFSALQEIHFARKSMRPYFYLGYWIEDNQSMAYKSRYKPHQLLDAYVDDHITPSWTEPPEPLDV